MIGEPLVVDTDVAAGIMRGSLPAGLRANIARSVLFVTFVTVGELYRGAVHARWGARRIAGLDAWLSRLAVIPGEQPVARRWGELTGRHLAEGRPLPANDAWIAACCLTHAVTLATLNVRHFATIEGLRLLTGEE